MKALVTLLLCGITSVSVAGDRTLPKEVKDFVAERDICDHFRGEPFEGNSREQVERRKFIADSLDIYCSGTDKRLAALKRRYMSNPVAMSKLNQYEERIEGAETN
jgi:hypothetical protein